MTAELRRALMFAGVGLAGGFALVVAFFGSAELLKRHSGPGASGQMSGSQRPLAGPSKEGTPEPKPGTAGPGTGDQAAIDRQGVLDLVPKEEVGPGSGSNRQQDTEKAKGPSLDIVRIEPTGDAVIAGRGTPNATVEVLRDNQPFARAAVDPTGQFAIVAPALPPGNSEITLRVTAPDGTVTMGRESVAVVIAKGRDTTPLVAVSEPDKPTRVLSQPEPSAQAQAKAKAGAAASAKAADKDAAEGTPRREDAKPGDRASQKMAALPAPGAKPEGKGDAPVKIVSVDAQEGGRLHVTGQATAWSTLRLYLNDTMVASGRSDGGGRIAFTIGRGVQPGAYQIRVDHVDAETGKVKNRAQVAFAYPANLAEKGREKGGGTASLAAPSAGPVPGRATAQAKPSDAAPAPLAIKPGTEGKPTTLAAREPAPKPSVGTNSERTAGRPPAEAQSLVGGASGSIAQGGSSKIDSSKTDSSKTDSSKTDSSKFGSSSNNPNASDGGRAAGTDGKAEPAGTASAPASAAPSKAVGTKRPVPEIPAVAAASGKPMSDVPSPQAERRAGLALAPVMPGSQTGADRLTQPDTSGTVKRAAPEAPAFTASSVDHQSASPDLDSDRRKAAALAPRLPDTEASAPGQTALGAAPSANADAASTGAGKAGIAPSSTEDSQRTAASSVPERSGTSDDPQIKAESGPMATVPAPSEQAGTVFVPEINTARIVRGDNLWQISRRTYGSGIRYTVIYDANQDQIRDPDLIYPGQIFVLPKDTGSDRTSTKRG